MPPLTIVISGASGLVGSAVVPALERAGHRVLRLVRHSPKATGEIQWNPSAHTLDDGAFATADVVVNLAGETIAKRWTVERRLRIRYSRIDSTATIARAIVNSTRPMTLINASAVGFYGDRGNDVLGEQQPAGAGFLADTCLQWESAANAIARPNVRVVTMRTGLVLSKAGGALATMLVPFRAGVGGRLGDGRQWMSWITIGDLVRAIVWIIDHPEIAGPVNAMSPSPVTNTEFTRALGKAIHRPTIFGVPAVALQLAFGEMAQQTLLASQRGDPTVLLKSGFVFESPTIEAALAKVLAK